MLVSSWDNRRDKGTWEEEQVRPGDAAETKGTLQSKAKEQWCRRPEWR